MISFFLLICYLSIVSAKVDRTWWRYTTLYEVYLQSFKDSNGDGIGDLLGLASKLDHFVDLGIESIYITPFYPSPLADGGYDVANYTDVHPRYGIMDDFDYLVAKAKDKGLKLILDMVLNHSSDEHPWFIKSTKKEEPYTDYYVWKDAQGHDAEGNPKPPNNWVNVFGGSAWQWNDQRKQFYLHNFTPRQPDLNYRSKFLMTEMKKIMKYWLNKGIAGFRFDAVKWLIEDEKFLDEPLSSQDTEVPHGYGDLNHVYVENQPGTYEILHELRKFMDRTTKKFTDYERIMMLEFYNTADDDFFRYFGKNGRKIAQLPLFQTLSTLNEFKNATFYHRFIDDYLNGFSRGETPTWNFENHDYPRKGTAFGEEYECVLTTMLMFLPGVAYVYYGQEMGMTGSKIRKDHEIDLLTIPGEASTRNSIRLPMQWDDSLNSGFSNSHKTFLPLNPAYWKVNVKKQRNETNSRYNMFKKMLELRRTDILKHGKFESYVVSTWVFAFTRSLKGREKYIIVSNLGSETEFVDLNTSIQDLPKFMAVKMASPNSMYKQGDQVSNTQETPHILTLRPYSILVLNSLSSDMN